MEFTIVSNKEDKDMAQNEILLTDHSPNSPFLFPFGLLFGIWGLSLDWDLDLGWSISQKYINSQQESWPFPEEFEKKIRVCSANHTVNCKVHKEHFIDESFLWNPPNIKSYNPRQDIARQAQHLQHRSQ